MTIIEKIKAEIERRMDKHWEGLPNADSQEDDWTHNELCELGAYKELEHLESFLDTLESEHLADASKTSPNDLVEAAKECNSNLQLQEYFIKGGMWQKEQMMKHAKDGWMDEEDVIILNDGTRIDLQPDYDKKPAFEFKYAQDVRVIVLPKEDEK